MTPSLLSPITIVLSGFAIVAVGAAWVLASLVSRKKASWRLPVVLSAGFGVLAVVGPLIDPSVALASIAVSAASLLFAASRGGLVAWAARVASRPAVQAIALALLGVSVVGYGLYRIDADLQKDMDEGTKLIGAASMVVDLGPSSAPAARTDVGRAVALWQPSAASVEDLADFSEEEYLSRLRLQAHLIQTGPVDGDYNCHGWVFTGGKSWVRGADVPTILMDNGYRETKSPMIGDLCVYRDDAGEVTHTAVVRGLGDSGMILLESKWGKLGRYIHEATAHNAYLGHIPTYYRSKRTTHRLNGLQGARTEAVEAAE